jgi:hypothetical protein
MQLTHKFHASPEAVRGPVWGLPTSEPTLLRGQKPSDLLKPQLEPVTFFPLQKAQEPRNTTPEL